jgi:hypothetical protein
MATLSRWEICRQQRGKYLYDYAGQPWKAQSHIRQNDDSIAARLTVGVLL